jgi:primary-amine oxidase
MIPYLDQEHLQQALGVAPTRTARVEVVVKNHAGKSELSELLVDLDHKKIIAKQYIEGKHSYIDADYMKQVEATCLANEFVKDEIRKLDLPPGSSVVVEPWAYATDGQNNMKERITMVSPNSCHHPLEKGAGL